MWLTCLGLPAAPVLLQQAVAGDDVRTPAKTAVLMCGQKEMTMLSTNILVEKGVAPERILLNF